MKSNRLAVFAVSLQCTDEFKDVSRVTPRSRTSVSGWSVSAAEKDREMGGRFSTVRHENLMGLIGRPHSSAQAQAEEGENVCS